MGCVPRCQELLWDASPLPHKSGKPDTLSMREVRLSTGAAPVAREVHRRMVEAGYGQKSLAVAAGLNETYVRDLLQGKSRNPKEQQLAKLAKALGCTIDDLLRPGRPQEIEEHGDAAQTPEERGLLHVWRRASPMARNEILRAIEGVMVGALTGLGKADDI